MCNMPLISVIVPIYNVEKYLKKCIDSIMGQTYKNLEIILVDDGSPDGCPEICDNYAETDSRIKVIHKENGGVSNARNVGIEGSVGEYICFVDSDDWIERDYISVFIERVKKDNTDGAVSNLFFRGFKRTATLNVNDDILILNAIKEEQKSLFFSGTFNTPWNKIFKSAVIKENNIKFRENCHFAEDTIFFFDYLRFVKSISIIAKPIYNYNITASVATNKFWPDMEMYMDQKLESQLLFLSNNSSDEDVKKWLGTRFAWQTINLIVSKNYLWHLKTNDAYEVLKRMRKKYFEYIGGIDNVNIPLSREQQLFLKGDFIKYYKHTKKQQKISEIKESIRNFLKSVLTLMK